MFCIILVALLCTASSILICLRRWGAHTTLEYYIIGLTSVTSSKISTFSSIYAKDT